MTPKNGREFVGEFASTSEEITYSGTKQETPTNGSEFVGEFASYPGEDGSLSSPGVFIRRLPRRALVWLFQDTPREVLVCVSTKGGGTAKLNLTSTLSTSA